MMVKERVESMGYWRHVKGGVILTGGGSQMQGAADLAYKVFGVPVRVGSPASTGGLIEEYRNPVYSTAVGLVQIGAERLIALEGDEPTRKPDKKGKKAKNGGVGRKISDWFKEFF